MKSLSEVRKYLSSIPKINSGGCGIAAICMYQWLEQHGKLLPSTSIVYCSHDGNTYFSNLSKLESNKTLNGTSHIVLKHRGKLLDCNGIVSNSRYYYKLELKSLKQVQRSVRKIDNWNTSFDREFWLDNIQQNMGFKIC